MLMTKERRTAIRTLRLGDLGAARDPASVSTRSTAGCRTRTDPHARERALAEARLDPPAALRTRRLRKSGTSWNRSATAPSVRPIAARPPDRDALGDPSARGRVLARPWRAGSVPADPLRR